MNEGADDVFFILIVAGFSMMLGAMIAAIETGESWEKTCIKAGVAQYNEKTGKWQWKEKYRKKLEEKEDESEE